MRVRRPSIPVRIVANVPIKAIATKGIIAKPLWKME